MTPSSRKPTATEGGIPRRTFSTSLQYVAGPLHTPKPILFCWKDPNGVLKAVFSLSDSSISTTWKAPCMSNEEKILLPASLAMLSLTVGIGKLSFFVMSLRRLQSMHHLILLPFFLAATRLKDQGELAGSMTSCFSHRSSWCLKSGSRAGLMGR